MTKNPYPRNHTSSYFADFPFHFMGLSLPISDVESEKINNIPDDIIEQIIIRLDVKDIIRCKSVCKWRQSLISSPGFVKSQLDHSYKLDAKTNGSGHRRIVMARITPADLKRNCVREVDDYTFDWHDSHLAGSSNGLVCMTPNTHWVLVANPSTREVRKMTAPCSAYLIRSVCWGFGYDSATDDYKVIRIFRQDKDALPCFLVLTLKSNAWKFVAHLRYTFISRIGVLCNGALHWLVEDRQNNKTKKLILSFCLSQEIFKEIPQPDDASYECKHGTKLGIFEGGLCLFRIEYRPWVMRSYNVVQSWEKLPYKEKMLQPDSAHYLKSFNDFIREGLSIFCLSSRSFDDCRAPKKALCHDHIDLSPFYLQYVNAPVFVQSLVSPHVKHGSLKRKMLENIGSRNHKLLKEDA